MVGRNAELVQRLRALAALQAPERFVYFWGAAGSGRTHLVKATLAALAHAGSRTAYVACCDGAQPDASLSAFDAIGIDDVERLGACGAAAFFSLYNALREHGKTLIVTGSAAPTQLPLRPDVVTRLAWGLVYEVHGLSDADKAAALEQHANGRGFKLEADVARYLLTHARRDMPALLAIVEALDRYSLESKRAVTVPLVRELLTAAGS